MTRRPLLLLVLGLGLAVASRAGVIPEVEEAQSRQETRKNVGLEGRLADPETAEAALQEALADPRRVQLLEAIAVRGTDLSARGRAILALRDLEDPAVDGILEALTSSEQPPLVGTWAAAARITRAPDVDRFVPLVSRYAGRYPAVARPIELKARVLLDDASTEQLLSLMSTTPVLAPAIGPRLLEADPAELVHVMGHGSDDGVRRQAAAYLASIGQQGPRQAQAVAAATVRSLDFDPSVEAYPWAGGALYVPGIPWKKDDARELVERLVQWNLLCDARGDAGERQQVQNNLRSVQLLRAAGFQNQWPDVNGAEVLVEWGRWAGKGRVREALEQTGQLESRWSTALDRL